MRLTDAIYLSSRHFFRHSVKAKRGCIRGTKAISKGTVYYLYNNYNKAQSFVPKRSHFEQTSIRLFKARFALLSWSSSDWLKPLILLNLQCFPCISHVQCNTQIKKKPLNGILKHNSLNVSTCNCSLNTNTEKTQAVNPNKANSVQTTVVTDFGNRAVFTVAQPCLG